MLGPTIQASQTPAAHMLYGLIRMLYELMRSEDVIGSHFIERIAWVSVWGAFSVI
jgi:hypothetical protein